jgi:WD40 repeat protein
MLAAGTQFAGFRIEGFLGRGGMAVVYEATQLSLHRAVALKLLSGEDPELADRFRREALLQAGIDHPHIVPVYEAGASDHGLYIAMRLIRGRTLKAAISARQLDPPAAIRLLVPIADALDAAHNAGLVHRDVKPQNILIGPRAHPYLADFGIVQSLDGSDLTGTGRLVGTPEYVAPEQVVGGAATSASDIYALAAVLYESLTLSVPYAADSVTQTLSARLAGPPPPPSVRRPGLPAAIDDALLQGLARDPAVRQATAQELLRDVVRGFARSTPDPELRNLYDVLLGSFGLRPVLADVPRELELATAPPLVGRDADMIRLRARWHRACGGVGSLVSLIGGPGTGKTRIAAELAGEAHRESATVHYASGSGSPGATTAAIGDAREASRPTLLVLDDLDHADASVRGELTDLAAALSGLPVLVVASVSDASAIEHVNVSEAIALEPLDAAAVRAIAARYAPGHPDEVPAEWLLAASGGIASVIHELAAGWARREAARRIGAVASRAAVSRGELRSIEAELAEGIVELEATRAPIARQAGDTAPVVCPFKGLTSFETADADYFFGREQLVAEAVARLVGAPLLGVVGPSGSGKSSVLQAGLLPSLAGGVLPGSERWTQVLIRPREHPLSELNRAMAPVDRELHAVLAIDQFEEVFTACGDEQERAAFIAEIMRLTADGHARLIAVLAIRADRYGRCADYPALAQLLAANHLLVGAMKRDELRRAIECPAARAGLHVEPALTDALVADVLDQPGALPLLSTALLELWQQRDGRHLRHVAYQRTGGVRGAVARLAESAFHELDGTQQIVAHSAMMRLVAEGSPGTVERRRVPLSELELQSSADVSDVVALFTDRRLLTVSDGTVEVAHEALLREWPRLRRWLDEDQQGRRLHRHLTEAAYDWDRNARDSGDLYRGARLASAVEWRDEHRHELNRTEEAFLAASQAAAQSELEAARRRSRRLRTLAVGLAVLVLLAAVSAVLAVRQTRRAESERRTAVSRGLAVQALAQLDQDPDAAALLSLEADRVAPTIEARSAVLSVLPRLEYAAGSFEHDGSVAVVEHMAMSRDGETLVAADQHSTRLWDVRSHRSLGQAAQTENRFAAVGFDRRGAAVAVEVSGREARLWDVRMGRARGAAIHARGSITEAALSPDGRTLAVAQSGGAIQLWDVRKVQPRGRPLDTHARFVATLAFSQDSRTLAAVSQRGVIRRWAVGTGQPMGDALNKGHGPVATLAFNDDGSMLAASVAGAVRLFDLSDDRAVGELIERRPYFSQDLAFSGDGAILASGGDDGAIRLWDIAHRRLLAQPLTRHTGAITGLAFGGDGRVLASAGEEGALRVWEIGTRSPLGQLLIPDAGADDFAISHDGETMAVAGTGGTRLWSTRDRHRLAGPLATGFPHDVVFDRSNEPLVAAVRRQRIRTWDARRSREVGRPIPGHEVSSVALASDGETMAVVEGRRDLQVWWDANGRRRLGDRIRLGPLATITSLEFDADAQRLATGLSEGTVLLWNIGNREQFGKGARDLQGAHVGAVDSLAFDPTGTVLASGGHGSVRLWDVQDGHPLGAPIKTGAGSIGDIAFSSDGTTLAWARNILSASGDGEGMIQFWDIRERRPLGQQLTAASGQVLSIEFTPDDSRLLSVGRDGVRSWDALLWSRSWTALQERVCLGVRRSLSRAEWQRFLPDEPYRETCPAA